MSITTEKNTTRPTRFAGLGYMRQDRALWRFVDTETGATIGALYRTKAELMADLSTFAAERGFAPVVAAPKAPVSKAYDAISAAAAARGLPTRFATDLTKHDRLAITAAGDAAPFVWALYPDGTHLIWLTGMRNACPPGYATNKRAYEISSMIKAVAESCEGALFFTWDGVSLQPCANVDAARERAQQIFMAEVMS